MKPRIYWAPPYVAALIMGALSFPGLASALTLEQALSVAEQDAPSLHAQAANLVAARSAAIPAGELPDPKLKLGLQSVPIEGDARWQLEQEAMTMQMVGVMQDVPNRGRARQVSDQPPLWPRVARLDIRSAQPTDLHAARQPDHVGDRGQSTGDRRTAHA